MKKINLQCKSSSHVPSYVYSNQAKSLLLIECSYIGKALTKFEQNIKE